MDAADPAEHAGPTEPIENGRTRGPEHVLVFAAAVVAQLWILALPFQLDDYYLLAHPLRLFDIEQAYAQEDVAPFMLRWTAWACWALVRAAAGEPLSALPFHALALALHGAVAVLLARCVGALVPAGSARWAGTIAGLCFGVAAGHVQAVSWPASLADVLIMFFGLLAFDALLRARERAARGAPTLGLRLMALIGLCLVPLSKISGIVALPALTCVIAASAWAEPRARRRRLVAIELSLCAFAMAVGLACRALYLGSARPRYHGQAELGPLELAARLPRALEPLGQALYPWNADPLFIGDEPWLARVLGLAPGDAPLLGWAVFGAVLLAGALCARAPRRALPVLAVALVPCLVPLAALAAGSHDNVLSRLAYLAFCPLAAAVGIALGALLQERRVLGVVLGLALGVLLVDGNLHVRRTERLAARETSETIETLRAAARDHAAQGSANPLTLLVVRPESGFGGIPLLGPHLERALRPPFQLEPLDVRLFSDGHDLLRRFPSLDLAQHDVAVLGPEVDEAWRPVPADPSRSGEANRQRRALRWLAPLRRGADPGAPTDLVREGTAARGAARWSFVPPLPAHALGALAVEASAASRGTLRARTGDVERDAARYSLMDPHGGILVLEPALGLAGLFGPPLESLAWEGEGVEPGVTARLRLPELALEPPDDLRQIPLTSADPAAPRWTCTPPAGTAVLRLELLFRDPLGPEFLLLAERPAVGGETTQVAPDELRFADPAVIDAPSQAFPWRSFAREHLVPKLAPGRLRRLSCTVGVVALSGEGVPLARAPVRTVRFVLPGKGAEEPATSQ